MAAGLEKGKKTPGERLPALTLVSDDTKFVRDPDSCLWDLRPIDGNGPRIVDERFTRLRSQQS